VHGNPETDAVWDPLVEALGHILPVPQGRSNGRSVEGAENLS
jgi:hypothetical protein